MISTQLPLVENKTKILAITGPASPQFMTAPSKNLTVCPTRRQRVPAETVFSAQSNANASPPKPRRLPLLTISVAVLLAGSVAAVRGQSAGKHRPRQQQGAEPTRNPVRNHRIAYTARSLQTQNKARHSLGNRSPIDPNQTSNSVSSRLRPGRKLGSAGARLNVISNSRMRARIKRTTFRPAIRRSHFGGEGFGFRHPVRLSRSSLPVSLGRSRSGTSLEDGFGSAWSGNSSGKQPQK